MCEGLTGGTRHHDSHVIIEHAASSRRVHRRFSEATALGRETGASGKLRLHSLRLHEECHG